LRWGGIVKRRFADLPGVGQVGVCRVRREHLQEHQKLVREEFHREPQIFLQFMYCVNCE
jgi:hypothetical protein